MSGRLPDWSSVASWPFAWSYVTTSKVRWMFGWLALKSLTTWSSTVFCSGASPPPRQQYQRISTGPPGGTVAGPWLAATALAAGSLAAMDGGALVAGGEALDPLHAVATTTNAASRTPGRERRDAMAPPPVLEAVSARCGAGRRRSR